MSKPTYIALTITLADGSESKASIQVDGGWQQWGASTEQLGETVELMESLARVAAEYLAEESDD